MDFWCEEQAEFFFLFFVCLTALKEALVVDVWDGPGGGGAFVLVP